MKRRGAALSKNLEGAANDGIPHLKLEFEGNVRYLELAINEVN